MLKENEWNLINNILLKLYTIEETEVLPKEIMNALKVLIPFSKGYFIFLNDEQKVDISNSYFFGMNDSIQDETLNAFYDKEYIQYLCNFSKETTIFKDFSVLIDDSKKNTEFYKKFLNSTDNLFHLGILLIKNNKLIGILNFFRNSILEDFSEKDIYIFNILKNHFENIIFNLIRFSKNQGIVAKCFKNAVKKFELSDRENEILELIADGRSNGEISDILCVSLSTVKKHVYNIFNKVGVNSRTQLLNSIYKQ